MAASYIATSIVPKYSIFDNDAGDDVDPATWSADNWDPSQSFTKCTIFINCRHFHKIVDRLIKL